MNKKAIILNLVWTVIAVGAYAFGQHFGSSSNESGNAGASSKRFAGLLPDSSLDETKEKNELSDAAKEVAGLGEDSPQLINGRKLSRDEMREAILSALNEPNPLKANLLFAQLLAQLDPENIESAMDTLRENADGQAPFRNMGLLTYAFGAMDGEKAIEYAQGIEGRGSVFTTSSALSGWASNDPQAAMAWLQSRENLEGMEKAMFARGLVNGLAQTDLNMATEYALSVGDADMQRQFFDVIAREQMNKGIEAASAWANTLPDDAKSDALYNIARQFTRDDLDAAAKWASNYATEPYGNFAVAEVADELSERDPLAAIDWLNSLPTGDAQSSGMAATFREWGRNDPTAASEYLVAMPDGASKDQAVGAFAATIAREDPESAITWASTVADPQIREQSMIRAGQSYFRTDPAAAQTWVQTSGLSREAQEAVLNPPRPDRGGGGGPGGGRRGGGPGGGFGKGGGIRPGGGF